jgi:IS6 family transposase
MILRAIAEKLKRRNGFKDRHFEALLILPAISWYLPHPLSYRDIEEPFLERGLEVDHSTLNRGSWPTRLCSRAGCVPSASRKLHCGSVRTDGTYIKIHGQWPICTGPSIKHGRPVDFSTSGEARPGGGQALLP